MTSANLVFRRTHLYLGMLLLPWLAIYALSTVVFNHREHFQPVRPASQPMLLLWEKDYALDVPAGNDALRDTARRILQDQGLGGAFGVQRQGPRLVINVQNFRAPTRLTYDPAAKKLRAEQRKSTAVDILIRLHERTGYGNGSFLNNLWAVIVDMFCVGTLAWVATGLYLWWKLPATRGWGFLAVGGGVTTLLVLLFTL